MFSFGKKKILQETLDRAARTGFSVPEIRYFEERFHQLDQSSTHDSSYLNDQDLEPIKAAAPFASKLLQMSPSKKITVDSFVDLLAALRDGASLESRAAALFSLLSFDENSNRPDPPPLTAQDLVNDGTLAWGPNPQLSTDALRAINAVSQIAPPTTPPPQQTDGAQGPHMSLAQFSAFLATRCPKPPALSPLFPQPQPNAQPQPQPQPQQQPPQPLTMRGDTALSNARAPGVPCVVARGGRSGRSAASPPLPATGSQMDIWTALQAAPPGVQPPTRWTAHPLCTVPDPRGAL
ncbi:hypothetical protein PAPYR_5702 [Paratrimastix pyriformis]|uniref:Uncharacterized protein n=1 Tax=Paratrimastix pyriformis TaxID=342808 RepID=A0ABQ8UJV7_9EUKA|nr:hypothetical protein PAPYR_5702 [Paratrimastix pyriformis]